MSQIKTSVEVIEVGKKIIQKFEGMIGNTVHNLNEIYDRAGQAGWNDKQYYNLGGVLNECTKELLKPISELEVLKGKLDKLKIAVEDYSK